MKSQRLMMLAGLCEGWLEMAIDFISDDNLEQEVDVLGALEEIEEARSQLDSLRAEWEEFGSEERLSDREAVRGEMLVAWLARYGEEYRTQSEDPLSFSSDLCFKSNTFREHIYSFVRNDKMFAEHAWLMRTNVLADDVALRKRIDREKVEDAHKPG